MIIDLTTKINKELIEPWLVKQENKHLSTGHVGTHLDTYLKSNIAVEYFKRNGVLIDASEYAKEREINVSDLLNVEIKEGDFVLFRTDQIKKEYGRKEYFNNHPQLSHELIQFLCDKKVSFIGIDASGIRRGAEHRDADILCEENNVYVIENLTNLDKLSKSLDKSNENFLIYTMWLEDDLATGLKCRVIAELSSK